MSTTITRSHWTDDSGTPSAPNGNGTVINEARLQEIYANIDSLVGSNISFGGTIGAEGAGTHSWSGSVAGVNRHLVRNTSTSAAAFAAHSLQNSGGSVGGDFALYSTGASTSGYQRADEIALAAFGAGGMAFAVHNATGFMSWHVGTSDTNVMRLLSSGRLQVHTGGPTGVIDSGDMVIASNVPILDFQELDQGTNQKVWRIAVNALQWSFGAVDDGIASENFAFIVNRGSGFTVSSFDMYTTLQPSADNGIMCGTASKRWSQLNAVLVNSGDWNMENGFTWTEHYKIERSKGAMPSGTALLNPNGDLVAFIDDAGRLYVSEVLPGGINALPWRRTTVDERCAHV